MNIEKTKINRKNIKSYTTDGNNKPFNFKIKLECLVLSSEKKIKLQDVERKLRTLHRVKNNLSRASELLRELSNILVGGNRHRLHDDIYQEAVLNQAVILIGACFVRGGKDRIVPVEEVGIIFAKNSTYSELREYRDILFSHLDENHDLRNDHIEWMFSIEDDGVRPTRSWLGGNRIAMPAVESILAWREFVSDVMSKIYLKSDEFEKQGNQLIGEVDLID